MDNLKRNSLITIQHEEPGPSPSQIRERIQQLEILGQMHKPNGVGNYRPTDCHVCSPDYGIGNLGVESRDTYKLDGAGFKSSMSQTEVVVADVHYLPGK